MRESYEWQLKPSIKQKQLDGLLGLVLAAFILSVSSIYWMLLVILLFVFIAFWLWRKDASITHIGLHQNALYLVCDEQKRYVRPTTGSIKQEKMVKLRWSIWPWQCLVLRPDSFNCYDDFKEFKRTIYGLI